MSLTRWRTSKVFRIANFLLLNFLTFQNLYGQEFHVQEGTHLYTPVLEIEGERLPESQEDLEAKLGEPSIGEGIPLGNNFWNPNTLSLPTPEVEQGSPGLNLGYEGETKVQK